MSRTNMVKNIKEIHPDTLLLFKVGVFCESYGKDSYILSYLFDYQIFVRKQRKIREIGENSKILTLM